MANFGTNGWMVALWLGIGFTAGCAVMGLWATRVIERLHEAHVDQLLDVQTWAATLGDQPTPDRADVEEAVADPLAILTGEMLTRLLDAALPKREDAAVADEGRPGSPAEYDPPDREVGDWTDPFFGLERQLVGGLRPGEGIPGIGRDDDAPDDLSSVNQWPEGMYVSHPLANGFTPDDDAAREGWRDLGGEVYEEWDQRTR